jgi:hypothetical protein
VSFFGPVAVQVSQQRTQEQMERSRSRLVLKSRGNSVMLTDVKGSSYPKALGHNDGADEAMPVEGQWNRMRPRIQLI